MNSRQKLDIRNFLVMIFSAVIGGFIALSAIMFYYGYDRASLAGDILTPPRLLTSLSYTARNPETNDLDQFVFNRIEYVHYNEAKNTWEREKADVSSYEALYRLVQSDKRVESPDLTLTDKFYKSNPSSVTIVVGTEKGAQAAKVFQEVQFLQNPGYYRIQLSGENDGWAYFPHKEIAKKVEELFLQ